MSMNKKSYIITLILILCLTIGITLIYNFVGFDIDTSEQGQSRNLQALSLVIILLLMIRGGIAYGYNKEASYYFKSWFIWLLIFAITIVFYAFRHEADYFSKRILSVLVPSITWSEEGQYMISRNQDGHFYLKSLINNKHEIKFLVDTGASGVALTQDDAIKIGIDISKLKYDQTHRTASGLAYSASVKLDTLQIGDKVFKNVSAHVSKSGLDVSLLGMSIIDDFSDFTYSKDNLIFKY